MFDARTPIARVRLAPGAAGLGLARGLVTLASLSLVAGAGVLVGLRSPAAPAYAQLQPVPGQLSPVQLGFNTLRLHGYPAANNPADAPHANRPATAGSSTQNDPLTGRIPEDAPYTEGEGPFDPLSPEAPRMDFATWDPAWISERLGDPALRAEWPGLGGIDEVSAGANIRAGGVGNASEKVWLRHWYEPQHLDKDLNADGRLTDTDGDGTPDAPANPTATSIDEWYPAIMTELTYMLVDNDPLPDRDPAANDVHHSAPRPVCGAVGGTRIVFPVGVTAAEADPAGAAVGYGLTSLDADFDGDIDMVNVTDEATLPGQLDGARIDFDGDGGLDVLDPNGVGLSCDELVVLHTDGLLLKQGQRLQFMDHYVEVGSVANSSVSLDIYYTGDLVPRMIQRRSIGIGAVALAGDTGPVQVLSPGGTNLGAVPVGPWFVYVSDVDARDGTAVIMVGRGLGAPCTAMESAPGVANRTPGGPWFLKRTYVDGHEYNVVGIQTCGRTRFQYLTLRAPLPKVPATIEQHSVRLQPYPVERSLPLPPPFNHEHTILEDIVALEGFDPVVVPPGSPTSTLPRPTIHYMGGPIGPVPPVLGAGEQLPYTGRDPNHVVGPYDNVRATRWFYVREDVDPAFLGQLREKFGATQPFETGGLPQSFFYNEQIFTLPWNYTEFVLPDQANPVLDPDTGRPPYDADNYLVTTAWTNPTARWRRWGMPDGPVPAVVPPTPPDLETNATPDGGAPFGSPRRAGFEFDPDTQGKLLYDGNGVRVFGGQPQPPEFPCTSDDPRRSQLAGAGDLAASDPANALLPVEVAPYTDPFAPFNPQHPHAPRGDSLTFNPAYMDEFRNFNEDLRRLYAQISNSVQNAREKVYHRLWYEPEYVTKIRFGDDCRRDLKFPAIMQEYTFLYVDMTDNPGAAPPGTSRFAFPVGTGAAELPAPNPGGTLPAGGTFGHGLTTFDANFDTYPEAATVHDEATLRDWMNTQWQANRPVPPGPPPPPVPGPVLDFDGDGLVDDLNADLVPLNGNEMVVFAIESLTLDLDPNTPEGPSAMFLDHLVTLENVTRGSRAQFRFWFTGGNGSNARPEVVGGVRSLDIGDAAIVDRFQDRITIVNPTETNTGVDGAWFVFVEDVATDDDRVTVTVGRALGASHSAIDDDNGGHDLLPGDPWYLKRFYVDGHEYNVVALMTQRDAQGGDLFQFITIRTPVPKGNFFNSQDTLFQQGYFLGEQPPQMSVLPPFNVDHTIAVDIERIGRTEFAARPGLDSCVGDLKPMGPLIETITQETIERRFGTELREIWSDDGDTEAGDGLRWETDQLRVTPYQFTEIELPEGQQYLLTLNWTSPVSRLAFYGCTLARPGPFPDGNVGLTHDQLAAIGNTWAPPFNIIPPSNRPNGGLPYYDARIGPDPVRVKMFYDPADPDSPFVNRRNVTLQVPMRTPRADIEKRLVSAGTALVGDEVAFEIVVKNTGNTRLTDVDVTDTFDTAHLDFLSSIPAPTSVNEGTGTVTWDNIEGNAPGGSFEPGESIVLSVKFTATSVTAANTPARNAARVAAEGGQVTAGPSSATVIVTNPPTPALRITKALTTDNPTTVGSLVVFEIKVHNVGNVALTDVDVSDAYLTTFLDFTSAIPAPTTTNEAAGLLTWDNVETHASGGTFDPGDTVTLTVTFTAMAPTPDPDRARNSARVTALAGSVLAGPVTAEVEIDAAPAPSIQVTKQLTTADPAEVGQTVKFEIRVTNNGNMALTDVDVSDTYDTAYLDFVTASPAQTSFNEPAGTIAWDNVEGNAPGGSFDPGETIVLTTEFVATAVTADPARARNSARVSARNNTIQDGPAVDDVEINPVPTPRLRITKVLTSADPAAVSQTVVFRITVFNAGDTTLTNVDVSDFFETANFDFLSASPSQSAVNEAAGSVMWDNIEANAPGGTFDPGEAIVITVNFTATAATQDPDRAQNAASASAAGGASAGPVTAQVKINAAPSPALRVQKRLVTVDPATVGDVVRFEVTVTNAGNTTLTDVDASDAYETEFLDFVSANPVQTTAIDQPAGIITWQNIESHAPGGTFDPGESIVLTVNFTAIAVTQDPARADNAAGATANSSTVQAQPVMASVEINAAATLPGTPLDASCARLVSNPLAIDVSWTDNSTFETVFEVESSVNGSPFAPIASVPSTTQAGTGTGYSYTTPNLIANASFQFRVRARNVGTGQVSSYATSSVCSTGQAAGVLGCVEGKVFAQGRSSHAGAAIYVGDAPVAVTDADGSFQVCGLPEGSYTMAAAGVCSLKAQATGVTVEGGRTVALNDLALAGGDVNDDEEVDLFDLVRIGADYRSQPPNDPDADCTQDGAVNLFDLVLVGSNYRKAGPLPWSVKGSVAAAGTAAAPIDWDRLRLTPQGAPSGAPLGLDATLTDDGSLEVRVTARKMEALFGADFTMRYDPERVKVVDALTSVPGVQIQPGEAWGAAPFIPLNDVDRQASEIRFAASLLKPAQPLSGDVIIATITFELLGGAPAGAYALTSVKLSDPLAGRIAVTWQGADITPELEPGALTERIYLPVTHRAAVGGRNR